MATFDIGKKDVSVEIVRKDVTFEGSKGPPGADGTDGQKGDKGDPGAGIIMKGNDTYENILLKSGAPGDMWLVSSDHLPEAVAGDGMVSDGGGTGAAHWTNVGPIQGPKGDQGDQGLKGDTGFTGADSMVPGPKGDPGDDGEDSTVPGPKGDKGDTGFPGADSTVPGPQGDPGNDGADSTVPGPKGDTGTTGSKGDKGDDGSDGTGVTIAGSDTIANILAMTPATAGVMWIANNDDAGAAVPGVVGDGYVWDLSSWTNVGPIRGPKGNPGNDGVDGADSTVPGPKGDPGNDGADSTVPGPKGDTGNDGVDGADSTVPGPKGDPGSDGADSTVPGPKGDPGSDGADSTVPGPKGDPGNDGADSTVPGPKGDPGDDGAKGDPGDKGDPTTVVGTIDEIDIDATDPANPIVSISPNFGGGGGGGGLAWETSDSGVMTGVDGAGYLLDCSAATRTVNLPVGIVGEQIGVGDWKGNAATNDITVVGHGSEKIMGLDEALTLDINNSCVVLTYANSTQGWKIIQTTPSGNRLPNILHGTGVPSDSLGNNGDIFLRLS